MDALSLQALAIFAALLLCPLAITLQTWWLYGVILQQDRDAAKRERRREDRHRERCEQLEQQHRQREQQLVEQLEYLRELVGLEMHADIYLHEQWADKGSILSGEVAIQTVRPPPSHED